MLALFQKQLENWSSFLDQIDTLNTINNKYDTFKKYKDTCVPTLLKMIFEQTTGMTKKAILKYMDKGKRRDIPTQSLVDTFTKVCDRTLSGHSALNTVCVHIRNFPQFREHIIRLFSGKPSIGMSATRVNTAAHRAGMVTPLIAVFNVSLANKIEWKRVDGPAYLMRKLDGMRCVIVSTNDTITAYSREGNVITGLSHFCDLLPRVGDWVLDGEVCIMNGEKEDFRGTISTFTSGTPYKGDFRFYAFDYLTLDEFFERLPDHQKSPVWSKRMSKMTSFLTTLGNNPHITPITYKLYTPDALLRLEKRVEKEGWEGLMLRMDKSYKSGRSFDLMKIKKFSTAEYTVCDVVIGDWTIIKGTKRTTVKAVLSAIIKHKGNYVNVGSGFSLHERIEFSKDPSKLIGKVIEVKYFEEFQDNDKWSLRFPTLHYFWGDKRDC